MRHRFIVSSVLAAAVSGIGCGDDEPARRQAVFWLGLSTTQGANCSSAESFELPANARVTATSMTGEGERLVDRGTDAVECTVRPSENGAYQVQMSIATAGEVAFFSASGVVSETSSDLDVSFQTPSFVLEQDGCTATVDTVIPGAIWLRDFRCPMLVDERTLGVTCAGTGALIFENCRR